MSLTFQRYFKQRNLHFNSISLFYLASEYSCSVPIPTCTLGRNPSILRCHAIWAGSAIKHPDGFSGHTAVLNLGHLSNGPTFDYGQRVLGHLRNDLWWNLNSIFGLCQLRPWSELPRYLGLWVTQFTMGILGGFAAWTFSDCSNVHHSL